MHRMSTIGHSLNIGYLKYQILTATKNI